MRSIPTITKNLLIINILAFLAYYVLQMRGIDINSIFGLHFFLATKFQVWQLFTYMFMHHDYMHIFFNMFALWMFGCVVERVWGPKRFLLYYIICGVGAGLIQEISQFVSLYVMNSDQNISMLQLFNLDETTRSALNLWTTVGASGAIYGILLAFGMIFPEERIFIFPLPIPIKGKWFVMIYVVVELLSALSTSTDGVAHFAHLGGMLFGFILIKYWQHPTAGSRYGRGNGEVFFENLRNSWEKRKNKNTDNQNTKGRNPDWDYNSRKKAEEAEIDKILDKIRKNGYGSLTAEEKQKLFDHSNKK